MLQRATVFCDFAKEMMNLFWLDSNQGNCREFVTSRLVSIGNLQMNTDEQSAQLHCHSTNDEQLADSAVSHPQDQRLGTLTMEDGNLQTAFFDGELPQFIINANDTVKAGRIDEAAKILNKDAIETFRKEV